MANARSVVRPLSKRVKTQLERDTRRAARSERLQRFVDLELLFCRLCRNSLTARRTSAETGANDFLDIAASAFTWRSVSHTTVLFILL